MAQPTHYRDLVVLGIPLVITAMSSTALSVVDTLFLGMVGSDAQGAASVSRIVLLLILPLGAAVGTAVQIAMSRSQTTDHRARLLWAGLLLAGVFALPKLGLAALSDPLVAQLDVEPELDAMAAIYLQIVLLGSVADSFTLCWTGALIGLEDSKTPLVATLVSHAVNVVLDMVLIFGLGPIPPLGITGAALATLLANVTGLIAIVALSQRTLRASGYLRLDRRATRTEVRSVLALSLPLMAEQVAMGLVWTYRGIAAARLGTAAAAAYGIVLSAHLLALNVAYGVSTAATTLAGKYFSTRAYRAYWHNFRAAMIVAGVGVGAIVALVWLGSGVVYPIFTSDRAVLALCESASWALALSFTLHALHYAAKAALRGAGKTTQASWIYFGALWLVVAPTTWAASNLWDGTFADYWAIGAACHLVTLLGLGYLLVRLRRDTVANYSAP